MEEIIDLEVTDEEVIETIDENNRVGAKAEAEATVEAEVTTGEENLGEKVLLLLEVVDLSHRISE